VKTRVEQDLVVEQMPHQSNYFSPSILHLRRHVTRVVVAPLLEGFAGMLAVLDGFVAFGREERGEAWRASWDEMGGFWTG
jgi:hypothetical protein